MDPRKRAWVYAGLTLAAGVGLVMASSSDQAANGVAPIRPKLGPGARVLLLGDSLAQGLAAPLGELVRGGGGLFQADGRVGTRIADWAATGLPVLQAAPTIALVSLGTNDMRMTDPTTEQAALQALVAQLRTTGARLVWIGPPTMPFPDRGVRAMLGTTGTEMFRSDALPIPRGPDGIHPTMAGYAGWAGALARWLG